MTDRATQLMEMICANPSDDAPRKVYADWLEEHGECDRSEFVRIQLELAKIGSPPVCLGDEGDDANDLNYSENLFKRGGPDYFEITSSYRVEIGDTVDVLRRKSIRMGDGDNKEIVKLLKGFVVRKADYDTRGGTPQLHEYTLKRTREKFPRRRYGDLRGRERELLNLDNPASPNERLADSWFSTERFKFVLHGADGPFWMYPTIPPHGATGYEVSISRGFVSSVTLPGAAWWGEACGECRGSGQAEIYTGHGGSDVVDCHYCHGTGRVNALGVEIITTAPIEFVRLTDWKYPQNWPEELGKHKPKTPVLSYYAATDAESVLSEHLIAYALDMAKIKTGREVRSTPARP